MNISVKNLINFIVSLDSSEVILFPGTFDPWHDGHNACLDLVKKDIPIIIIPDRNPEKKLSDTDLKKLHLVAKENKNYHVFSDFVNSTDDNPTYFWYQSLKNELKYIKIHLLMGFDSYNSMDKWIEGTKLISILDSVLVVARMNQVQDFEQDLDKYQKISKNFKAEFLGHHLFENESSSNIKKGLK